MSIKIMIIVENMEITMQGKAYDNKGIVLADYDPPEIVTILENLIYNYKKYPDYMKYLEEVGYEI